ncbi:MAG: PilN domain-containing protein [Roseimicrobium sp.]
MSASAATFLLPDAELTWGLRKSLSGGKVEQVDSPAECRADSKGIVVGLPATACRTLGLILPTTDSSLLPAMVEAQLERRGVHLERAPAPNFAWHLLGQSGGQSFVSVDVLLHPFPAELVMKHAANYTSALRLLSLPVQDLVVVEEQGLLVLAASHQGKLWHSHVLGFSEMSPVELAREVELTRLSLEAQDGFGVVRALMLVGERLGALKSEVRKYLAWPIETPVSLPASRHFDVTKLPKLLPQQVFAAQASREGRRRLASILALTAVLYAVLVAFGWWYLGTLQEAADALEKSTAVTREPAAEVKRTAQRWRALEPAIDAQRYPMLQLSHITGLMPPSGLVLKKFEAKPDAIELRGDARDLQTAAQFLEDLKKHPKLGRFTWQMPTPDMKNKIASFKIQGKLEGGS